MTDSRRSTRRDRIVVFEVVLLSFGFVLAYWLDHLVVWLAWAVGSAVVAGATLLTFNRGFEPAEGD